MCMYVCMYVYVYMCIYIYIEPPLYGHRIVAPAVNGSEAGESGVNPRLYAPMRAPVKAFVQRIHSGSL